MGETRPPEAAKRSSGPFRVVNAASLGERPESCHLVREVGRPGISAHADHRPSDYRYPRTQREAGIEFAEWEDRLSPIRPWMFWLAVTLCWVVFGAAAWVMVGS